jgi:putative transposase
MAKFQVPEGWVVVAYRFEVDRPERHPAVPSHQGARRFAWNWALGLVEEQLRAKEAFKVLALRQGARAAEAEGFAKEAAALPALVELEEQRRKDYEANGEKSPYRPISTVVPWPAYAMRYVRNRVKHEAAPWWGENSKECYSSAFEALDRAFKGYFSSRDGSREGPRVGWPRRKGRRGRQSTSFTTGAIKVLDRHHVQLPVVGALRTKEQTDKLRLESAGKRTELSPAR